MKKVIVISFLFFLNISCISEPKKKTTTNNSKIANVSKKKQVQNNPKQKVGSNTYKKLLNRTLQFANNLDFNLAYIRNKGLKDKKYLAEFLGLYLKLNKSAISKKQKKEIRKRLAPFYKETLKASYHNMATVNDKLFKANSMSYMRIMWLLNELGYDISLYKKELEKVQKRMDNHMNVRGPWQRAVFDKYYDFFKIKKPIALNNAKKLKGSIGTKEKLVFYDRAKAYEITHFIFAAYDYGNKKTQSRFDNQDLNYLKEILPQIIKKFELKNNDDLVGELLTCQILIGDTTNKAFKMSYQRLMNKQNNDGSFGNYERGRNKHGKDLEFRYYLHTTLVCSETFIEYEYRQVKNIFE